MSEKTQTMNRLPCPKCGGFLRKSGATPGGKQRWRCDRTSGCGYGTTNPSAGTRDQAGNITGPVRNPQFRRKLSGIKRFVITAAQNATPIHEDFLSSLQQYCAFNKAELVVIPIRYKNPTSRWAASQENEESWDPKLAPYLYNQRKKLCEHLMLLGDIKTVPTAERPLSGFEAITHGESGILGHTKLQLTTIPTPQDSQPKIMTTTGAITVPNYTDSKAGKKGEFHHTLGAVAVDIVGTKFFLRQINADKRNGDFIDLGQWYTPEEVLDAPPAKALVMGDTHRAQMDPRVERATFGPEGMAEVLDPEMLVFHDLHDGRAVNHHERKDPFAQISLREEEAHLAEQEVRDDVAWLQKVGGRRQVVIVPSNHDDFLTRWLRDVDWRRDPDNAEFYLESALAMVKQIKQTGKASDVFPYWVDKLRGDSKIRCLGRRESCNISGIELSLHGDLGPNGSRGSRQSLRRIGVKTIIGHSHSPGIEEGCYQVGTSSKLNMGYNIGPSSWMHAHCAVYANGKRSLLFIVDGQWRFK